MKKEEDSAFFCESKWIVGTWAFLLMEGIIVILSGLSLACPYGKIQLALQGVALIGPILFFVGKIKSWGKPIIEVNNQELAFNGQKFKWEELTRISLESVQKSFVPRLKIEWGKIPYFVELRYMSDSERRLMLNEIEKHKAVQYIKCSYEKNYTFWDMVLLVIVMIAIQVGIACAIIMAVLQ